MSDGEDREIILGFRCQECNESWDGLAGATKCVLRKHTVLVRTTWTSPTPSPETGV